MPLRGTLDVDDRIDDLMHQCCTLIGKIHRENPRQRSFCLGTEPCEVLTSLGAITHRQYGGVLQRLLTDPDSPDDDKLRAMIAISGPRMAAIIDGIGREEAQHSASRRKALGRHHGLSAEELMNSLLCTTRQAKNEEVRAVACALVYGLSETSRSCRSELLQGFNTLYESCKGKFASHIKEYLINEMKTAIPRDTANSDLVRPTDEWRNLSTGSIWKGDIEVRPDHSYQYTKENSTVTRIRDRSGRWRTVSGTKAIR